MLPRMSSSVPVCSFDLPRSHVTYPCLLTQTPASVFPEDQWTSRVEPTSLTTVTAQKQKSNALPQEGQGEELGELP